MNVIETEILLTYCWWKIWYFKHFCCFLLGKPYVLLDV